ncbi:MAG TPA: hypothetical protein VMV44_00390 [Rectinemataceae bacterium]|nr:hypothetical protein [Rectinemataceae bacterium]
MKFRKTWILALAAALALVAAAGLAADDDEGSAANPFAASNGPSGLKWVAGNSGGSLMNPGLACISCHTRGEGPRFAAAGTVYAKLDEKNLDLGVEGATVQIIDAKGRVLTLKTNKSGNFSARRGVSFTFPITAKVIYKGKTSEMYSPQKSGDCNLCHTQSGAKGAPGRVAIP